MSELNIQKFLRGHADHDTALGCLQSEWGIKAKRSLVNSSLVLFDYHQFDSPKGVPIVEECRGIILDSANNWDVASYGMNRFYNFGEKEAASLDHSSMRVLEKLDGSLIHLYWYADKWNVATRGNPDAAGSVGKDSSDTFAQLFWRTWDSLGYKLPDFWRDDMRDGTFFFELITPENQNVVRVTEPRIVLLGIRSKSVLLEYEPKSFWGYELPKTYAFNNPSAVLEFSKSVNGFESEGFVAVDRHFNRVKIKAEHYVKMHHLKSEMSLKRIFEVVLKNEQDELLAYLPELKPEVEKAQKGIRIFLSYVTIVFDELKNIENQKVFAHEALKHHFSSILFELKRDKNWSALKSLQKMPVEKAMTITEIPNLV